MTLLHAAISNSSVEELLHALDSGLDIDSKDSTGRTPLHLSVEQSFEDGLDLLLEKGANIDIKDGDGNTPLHLAIKLEKEPFVTKILNKGANVEAKNNEGHYPLHYVTKFTSNKPILRLLLLAGAIVNVKDEAGNSPMYYALENGFENARYLQPEPFALILAMLDWGGYLYFGREHVARFFRDSIRVSAVHALEMDLVLFYMKTKYVNFNTNLISIYSNVSEIGGCAEMDYVVFVQSLALKKAKFGNNSLYDVFSKYRNPSYISNTELEQKIFSCELETEFWVYASLLRATFERAKIRAALFDVAQSGFSDELPSEIARYIFSFLEDEDIRNFIKARECKLENIN